MGNTLPERVKSIIEISRKLATKRIANGENYSSKGALMNKANLIKSIIRNLINKEDMVKVYMS